jgi:SAM-dependent methyltransferase
MYGSRAVAQHCTRRCWNLAVDFAHQLGLDANARVMDLGCGDGAFANSVLAQRFAAVDGFDLSEAAIERASANAPGPHVRFERRDLTMPDASDFGRYDGAFLIGILHHVKTATPEVLRMLREVTGHLVVLEPNGNHLVRKLLELTPAYRAAGEDSFRRRTLERLFRDAGYKVALRRRYNLFPNFTPEALFRLLAPLEPRIEAMPGLRGLCTVTMYGLRADQRARTLSRRGAAVAAAA